VAGRPKEWRCPRACSLGGDVHLRVSASPSSGFAMVPLAVAPAHNPRVVDDDRWCGRVTFLDSNGVRSDDGRPKVNLGGA
jgi:hypothetical protein